MTQKIEETTARLRVCAEELSQALYGAQHDLWDGETFHVAPARLSVARQLRAKGVQNLSPEELDFVMFKCFTTMGDEGTFRYFLPRFLAAAATYPAFRGWVTTAGALRSKCEVVGLAKWSAAERTALLAALDAFAHFEWSLEAEPSEPAPQGVRHLLDYVNQQRRKFGQPLPAGLDPA